MRSFLKMKEERSAALGELSRQLEAQHQASLSPLKAHWLSEQEAELQQRVTSLVASAKAAWEEQQQVLSHPTLFQRRPV